VRNPPGGFLTLGIALLGLAYVMELRKRRALVASQVAEKAAA
jgi:hypothetical protein